ncbi:unnamed protein product [Microthlaspi erraticum]|uniref:Uncharacterized protein n=1 Tax=Microthlaspi erraticum TaxID=1685480 RepID=A0A6D2IVW2_9BRAS|nr:unnamed protein product [Microthlaspi erraticum]
MGTRDTTHLLVYTKACEGNRSSLPPSPPKAEISNSVHLSPGLKMSRTDSGMPQNEDFFAPPPLGPELAGGKWKVHVIDDDGKIIEENITGKQVWGIQKRRVIVEFNRNGQPIKDSGGLLGSWLGSLSYDLNILPINYTDWRKVPEYRKEMAWTVIQKKFLFDDPTNRRKYVISTLGSRCKDLKQRFWKLHKRNTPVETIEARPALIPEDQWRDFVHTQFTDKAKKARERNKVSRSNLKIPHTLGKKSIARRSDEMERESGVEPTRGEMFIASRTRSDGSMICEEARLCADQIKDIMNLPGQTSSSDAVTQVFGPEHSGRVRCVGRGPAPTKYFSSLDSTMSYNVEIVEMKSTIKNLADKVEIIASALHKALTCNRFQVNDTSETDENIRHIRKQATNKRKHQDLSPVVQTTPRAKVKEKEQVKEKEYTKRNCENSIYNSDICIFHIMC